MSWIFLLFLYLQPFGVLAIQLANYYGVKVLATAHSPEDQKFLEELRSAAVARNVEETLLARVIRVWDTKDDLVEACLEETGGLGVDIVIDSGGLPSIKITLI
ncbi:hypothetical protein DNTS_034801 [Danionella cerebrum]|uniref:Alcohol dehydrogenase-like C-terminal domain-containing protein n=1 Tax=Danionella cerebrum TaxID=2873325 RepID=A0A553NRM6_9TELE|nr:hypothetical protein DNTS_034801 [Danionella translucida]